MIRFCEFCGEQFATANPRRIYCSALCRRSVDNEKHRDRRAAEAEIRAEYLMPDVWERGQPEDITANALLDGWTADCVMPERMRSPDMECPSCPHWIHAVRSKKKRPPMLDLLCAMCRNGAKV